MQYECYSEDTAKGFQDEIGNRMMTKIFIKHNFSAPNFHGNIVTCDDLTRMNFKCPSKLHANSGFSPFSFPKQGSLKKFRWYEIKKVPNKLHRNVHNLQNFERQIKLHWQQIKNTTFQLSAHARPLLPPHYVSQFYD